MKSVTTIDVSKMHNMCVTLVCLRPAFACRAMASARGNEKEDAAIQPHTTAMVLECGSEWALKSRMCHSLHATNEQVGLLGALVPLKRPATAHEGNGCCLNCEREATHR